ncbi:unnamed protein product [Adineta steineri]|uniref:Uncharacterized protein n=1 Tax=Adineta steineri TaxID=433720 RepID=A0A814BIK8_9BILA|nr:unnamed protein product [Adineta steineri]CAF0992652.1 unnamed protein product [Adineta steineri]
MENEDLCFMKLFTLYSWKEIKNCPGRYLLTKQDNEHLRLISPSEILNNKISIQIFDSEICRDRIHIGKFIDGGLLSYEKSDGTFVHTLNNISGLTRKMNHLNVHFDNQILN